jgi:YidC/Oxa1 family membrane protein insertase
VPGSATTFQAVILQLLKPLVNVEQWLLEALHSTGLGWGLAIVGLTLLVRAAIVPITVRQFHAQRRLAEHAPELKRLRERHRDDPLKLREQTIAYYREHGINPLGAFLPLLLQIPIFISLYALMREDVGSGVFEHAGFLFIPDITAQAHGAVLVALVVAYACSQLASTLVATRTLQGGQRGFAIALPLLFIGVVARFPAGLLVYWITSSLWSLGQQLVLWRARRELPVPVLATPEPGPARKPHPVSKKRKRKRRR